MAPLGIVHIFAASVFAAALQFHIVTGSPSAERRDWQSGQLTVAPESKHTCEPFYQPYCRCVSSNVNERTHALFPNKREQDAAEAQVEFGDFVSAIKSRCSDKIGGLFCFFYFPYCEMALNSNVIRQAQEFLPCREVCEEVRSECETTFLASGYPWPEFLDCSRDYFKSNASGGCIPVQRDPRQGYDACVRENTTPISPATDEPHSPPTRPTDSGNSVGTRRKYQYSCMHDF